MAKSTFDSKDRKGSNKDLDPNRNLDPLKKKTVMLDDKDMKKLKGILNGRQT